MKIKYECYVKEHGFYSGKAEVPEHMKDCDEYERYQYLAGKVIGQLGIEGFAVSPFTYNTSLVPVRFITAKYI